MPAYLIPLLTVLSNGLSYLRVFLMTLRDSVSFSSGKIYGKKSVNGSVFSYKVTILSFYFLGKSLHTMGATRRTPQKEVAMARRPGCVPWGLVQGVRGGARKEFLEGLGGGPAVGQCGLLKKSFIFYIVDIWDVSKQLWSTDIN